VTSTFGLYLPGTSVLHRLPAGVKLATLVAAGACSLLLRTPLQVAVAVAVVLLGYTVARIPGGTVVASARPLLWVVVPLAAFQMVTVGWRRAVVIVGVILALVMLANLVTLTTRTSDLIDVVVRGLRPLQGVGVDSERIGLMLNLAIRAVPLVVELAEEVREAQHARGRAASARAFAVPLVVGAIRRADELAEALAARGLDDGPSPG